MTKPQKEGLTKAIIYNHPHSRNRSFLSTARSERRLQRRVGAKNQDVPAEIRGRSWIHRKKPPDKKQYIEISTIEDCPQKRIWWKKTVVFLMRYQHPDLSKMCYQSQQTLGSFFYIVLKIHDSENERRKIGKMIGKIIGSGNPCTQVSFSAPKKTHLALTSRCMAIP